MWLLTTSSAVPKYEQVVKVKQHPVSLAAQFSDCDATENARPSEAPWGTAGTSVFGYGLFFLFYLNSIRMSFLDFFALSLVIFFFVHFFLLYLCPLFLSFSFFPFYLSLFFLSSVIPFLRTSLLSFLSVLFLFVLFHNFSLFFISALRLRLLVFQFNVTFESLS
jgi:hypothetical protein